MYLAWFTSETGPSNYYTSFHFNIKKYTLDTLLNLIRLDFIDNISLAVVMRAEFFYKTRTPVDSNNVNLTPEKKV